MHTLYIRSTLSSCQLNSKTPKLCLAGGYLEMVLEGSPTFKFYLIFYPLQVRSVNIAFLSTVISKLRVAQPHFWRTEGALAVSTTLTGKTVLLVGQGIALGAAQRFVEGPAQLKLAHLRDHSACCQCPEESTAAEAKQG